MHLSKVKHSKFNESGQLLVFYLSSVVWGADIILRVRLSADTFVLLPCLPVVWGADIILRVRLSTEPFVMLPC